MLPLVGYNPNSFGIGNFVSSYLNETNEYVVVKLRQMSNLVKGNSKYRFDFVNDNHVYVVLEIPKEHQEAARLFREGKYSKFAEESKKAIRLNSRLPYKVAGPGGQPQSAIELLVLEKSPVLKEKIEKELDVKLDFTAELASVPDEDNFYVLSLSNQLIC